MSNVTDLISALQTGDDEATKATFDAVMATKVSAALDSKRIDVAASIYNATTGEDDVDIQATDDESLGSED